MKKQIHAPAYPRKEIARLRGLGMQRRLHGQSKVSRVSHITPRAYCIAKPATCMAVFVVPPPDRETQVHNDPYTVVTNPSANEVKLGDWCSLAYANTNTCGQPVVLEVLK